MILLELPSVQSPSDFRLRMSREFGIAIEAEKEVEKARLLLTMDYRPEVVNKCLEFLGSVSTQEAVDILLYVVYHRMEFKDSAISALSQSLCNFSDGDFLRFVKRLFKLPRILTLDQVLIEQLAYREFERPFAANWLLLGLLIDGNTFNGHIWPERKYFAAATIAETENIQCLNWAKIMNLLGFFAADWQYIALGRELERLKAECEEGSDESPVIILNELLSFFVPTNLSLYHLEDDDRFYKDLKLASNTLEKFRLRYTPSMGLRLVVQKRMSVIEDLEFVTCTDTFNLYKILLAIEEVFVEPIKRAHCFLQNLGLSTTELSTIPG